MNTSPSDVEAAVQAGAKGASIPDRSMYITADSERAEPIPVTLVPDGSKLQLLTDAVKESLRMAPAPRRLRGAAQHQELESFIGHLNRFKDGGSVVWADPVVVRLTAVLNYARADEPRWGDHRSVYTCPLSREWRIWTAAADRSISQDDLAEFLEQNEADLVGPGDDDILKGYPQPSYMLQFARFCRINTKSTYERATNPTTGDSVLIAKVEQEQSSTKIPSAFLVGIPVFEAGALYRLEARLRLQLKDGRPWFSFALPLADAVKRDAFNEVRAKVAAETDLPVYAGAPEEITV